MFRILGIPEELSNKLIRLVCLISALIFIEPMVTNSSDIYLRFDPSTGVQIPYLNYCNIRWNHVMCYYGSELGKDCRGQAVHVPMTNRDRHLILLRHNMFRNKVAAGDFRNQSRFGIAGEMFELTWSYELEMLAQRWANQCIPYQYDANRDSPFYTVSQNVYSGCFYNHYDLDAEFILKNWGEDQIKHVTEEAWLGKANRLYPEVTQVINMVWHTVRYIGCARRLIKVDKNRPEYRIYFVCNYAPAADLREKPPYQEAKKTCTKCLCLYPYPNLCVAESPQYTMAVGHKRYLDRDEIVKSGANSTGLLAFLLPLAFLLIYATM